MGRMDAWLVEPQPRLRAGGLLALDEIVPLPALKAPDRQWIHLPFSHRVDTTPAPVQERCDLPDVVEALQEDERSALVFRCNRDSRSCPRPQARRSVLASIYPPVFASSGTAMLECGCFASMTRFFTSWGDMRQVARNALGPLRFSMFISRPPTIALSESPGRAGRTTSRKAKT